MKKVIYKAFTVGGFEKEEQWLNEMAAKGLCLTEVGFCKYVFEEGIPGEYSYRLELLENLPSHPESQAYIHFMEETGVEQVATLFRWVYFRKKKTEGEFDLFSDLDSRIKHYTRINTFCYTLMLIQILPMLSNLTFHTNHEGSLNGWVGLLNAAVFVWVFWLSRGIRKQLKFLKNESKIRE